VDTLGLIWKRQVHPADVQEGARRLLPGLKRLCLRLEKIGADGNYSGGLKELFLSNHVAPLAMGERSRKMSGKT
jgi:hypothetical protein